MIVRRHRCEPPEIKDLYSISYHRGKQSRTEISRRVQRKAYEISPYVNFDVNQERLTWAHLSAFRSKTRFPRTEKRVQKLRILD